MSIAEELRAAVGGAGLSGEEQMARRGLTLAVVTNVNDPDKLNRVKCVPIENDKNQEETDWCYVMAPLGGRQCGQFFFPNVNDRVVLAYLGGDPGRPMVIGAYWSKGLTPPYVIDEGKVFHFSIKTPGGTELLFYDEPGKQRATLSMPSGAVLQFDDEARTVAVRDQTGENALTMDWKDGNVELKAGSRLTLSAGQTSIVLESSGNLTQKAGNKVDIQGTTVQVKAGAALTLQASGAAEVKGAIVNIN